MIRALGKKGDLSLKFLDWSIQLKKSIAMGTTFHRTLQKGE